MSKMLILFDIARRLGLAPYIGMDIRHITFNEDHIKHDSGEKVYETEILYAIQHKIEELMKDED